MRGEENGKILSDYKRQNQATHRDTESRAVKSVLIPVILGNPSSENMSKSVLKKETYGTLAM